MKIKDGEIEGYPENCRRDDGLLYDALKTRLLEYGGKGEEAFKEDFYKPKSDGSKGPIVRKVKIESNVTLGVELNNGKAFAANR